MTSPSSSRSSALTSNGAASLGTDVRFGAGPSLEVRAPLRSSSTAWRKLTPSARITQSITLPPAAHAPMQCHRFLCRRDDQARLPVVVERAQPDQVPAMTPQHDPACLGQALDRHLGLEPLDLSVGDAGQQRSPVKRAFLRCYRYRFC